MSLRDTIEAARKEAEEAGNIPGSSAKEARDKAKAAEESQADEREKHTGFSKRSVSRARPAREAAQGVRVVDASKVRSGKQTPTGKTEREMTKEERKAARAQRRSQQDRQASATRVILNRNPEYRRGQKIWWILLGSGFACTIISTLMVTYFPGTDAGHGVDASILSVILIVVAYAAIIAALVYDFRKVRPLRNAADDLVASMSEKKIAGIIEEDLAQSDKRAAKKAEAKAAKEATRKNSRHEQHK